MNVHASMSSPVRCAMSAIGWMSGTSVRDAQLARTASLRVHDLARQTLHVLHDVRPGARQPDVRGVDAEVVDEMKDADLLLDRRHPHGWRLQPVPQRLVIEHHRPRRQRGGWSTVFQS